MASRNTATRDRHRAVVARGKPPCALCEQPIDYTLKWPDPMCFTVDHIVPIGRNPTPERILELDVLSNKQPAHFACNRTKWDKVERKVLLICGPPGAGKTTAARASGLTVYDVDDEHWHGEQLFRQALEAVARDPNAQAAVIRSAATLSARQAAAQLCGATAVTVIETDLATCIERIAQRKRTTPPIKTQIAAAQDWWNKYEPGHIELVNGSGPRAFVTTRSW